MIYQKSHNVLYFGNLSLLYSNPLAIYCSKKIPLSLLEECEELVLSLARHGSTLAGGWQSPVEKRLLKAVTGVENSKIIYCLAKGIKNFHPPKYLSALERDNRLLVLSQFKNGKRITRELAIRRDQWMKGFMEKYLFCYADPGGNLKSLLENRLQEQKQVYILHHPQNTVYEDHGAIPVNRYNYREVFQI